MYVRSNLGFTLPLVSLPTSTAMASAATVANAGNWAAPPVGTHSSWQSQLPGALIASGYILSQSSNGQVAISKAGRNVTQSMPVSALANNVIKDASGKIVFACCGYSQPTGQTAQTTQVASSTPAAVAPTGASAGEVLTGVGSILSALAAPAAGIFQTYTESKMAKAALKREQQMPAFGPMMQPQVIQQGPSTGLILGLVGGFAAIALVLVLVLKK